MSSSRIYKKNIETAFKALQLQESSSLNQKQLKNVMDSIALDTNLNSFDSQLFKELWQNSRKNGDSIQLKNFFNSVSDAYKMLEQKLKFTISQQTHTKQQIYQTRDFRDYKILYSMFGSSNSSSKSVSNSRLSFIEQDQNAQILNRIKGVAQNPAMKLVEMGVIQAGEKKFEQALKFWKQALDLEPNNYLHHSNICRTLNVLGRYKEAATYGQTAVKINDKEPYPHMNLALAYAGMKKLQLAQKYSKIGYDLSPNNPLCCVDRAYILDQAGKSQEADKLYQIADKLNLSQSRIKFNQDHINETLERKFKRLVQYIDKMAGIQDDKKQLKQDVQGLKKDMIESKFIIEAYENMMKKQEKKQEIKKESDFEALKEKFDSIQKQIAVISNQANKFGQAQGGLIEIVQGQHVQVEKLDRQVKKLRDQMKKCLNELKGMQSLMERIESLEKKMSESPSLSSKKQSGLQLQRLTGINLETINDQLNDIIKNESPETLAAITVKIENTTEMNPQSVSSFCQFLKELKNLQNVHLILKQVSEGFLSKLKESLPEMSLLSTVKLSIQNGDQKILRHFKEQITKKKSSISCQINIKI